MINAHKDLNTRTGVDTFLELFGTRGGRWLANRLNLRGKGSETMAGFLSSYCWNMRAAYTVDDMQQMKATNEHRPNVYKTYCQGTLKQAITDHPMWNDLHKAGWRI